MPTVLQPAAIGWRLEPRVRLGSGSPPLEAIRGSTSSGVTLHSEVQESAPLGLLSSQSSLAARKPSPQTGLAGGEPLGAFAMHCARAQPLPEPHAPPKPLTPDEPRDATDPDEPPHALARSTLITHTR